MSNNDIEYDFYNTVDEEELYVPGESMEIVSPFDPRQVDIDSKPMVISNIVERLKYDEIVLDPDFQRNSNLWNKRQQSRLIESLLICIPLPVFYFDMTEEDKLIVVDGLQRLCAIRNFMAKEPNDQDLLELQDLEYLKDLEGKTFYKLPPNLQRRLREQTIQTYVIKPGTPDKVRNSIFERINTGGLVLTPAEIKNSVYRGRASLFVKRLAESEEFVEATNGKINPERMLDREFVNRFLAFYLLGIENYHENLEDYLNDVLILLKNNEKIALDNIEKSFKQAMNVSKQLFGEHAFKKKMINDKYGRINKPLFEAVTVQLAKLSADSARKAVEKKERILEKYAELFDDEMFIRVITNGTASLESVKYRHNEIARVINGCLEEDE